MYRVPLLCACLALALGACEPPPATPTGAVRAVQDQPPLSAPSVVAKGVLEGDFFVSGPISEGSLLRDSSHFYVWLEGSGAAELYRRIPGAPTEYPCEDGHAWEKRGYALICITVGDSTAYRCYFGIDVAEERLVVGVSC